jgi:hypothetical protein
MAMEMPAADRAVRCNGVLLLSGGEAVLAEPASLAVTAGAAGSPKDGVPREGASGAGRGAEPRLRVDAGVDAGAAAMGTAAGTASGGAAAGAGAGRPAKPACDTSW